MFRSDKPAQDPQSLPRLLLGLVRVQWGGPWTKPGVPMAARYRKTHWVAVSGGFVFDVNGDQWLEQSVWAAQLIRWLLPQCCEDGDGAWWPTHGSELDMEVRG